MSESSQASRNTIGDEPELLSRGRSSAVNDRHNHELARAIVGAVRDPLVLLDRSLRVVAASDSFINWFRLERSATWGRSLSELRRPQLSSRDVRQLLERVIISGAAIDHETILDIPGMGLRHLKLHARPIPDASAARAAVIVGFDDITERYEIERRDLLARRQEILLGEMQHRITNSLQIIAGIFLLKARTERSRKARSLLRDMHRRVISVATVQELLLTTRRVDKIDIGSYLSKLCEGLADSLIADDNAIALTVSSAEGIVLPGHATSLGLIVTELVINALKHGLPNGRPGQIVVDFRGNMESWCLSVSDNGIGRVPPVPAPVQIGRGSNIVEALARLLKARMIITARSPGSMTEIIHPQ